VQFFDTSGIDDKEIRSRVIQARKCIACLNGILWSKDIRKERKLNICNALIKSSLLHGSETSRLTENNKRRVEATEMDALRRSSRIQRKFRFLIGARLFLSAVSYQACSAYISGVTSSLSANRTGITFGHSEVKSTYLLHSRLRAAPPSIRPRTNR
jgi:hypothetical protein